LRPDAHLSADHARDAPTSTPMGKRTEIPCTPRRWAVHSSKLAPAPGGELECGCGVLPCLPRLLPRPRRRWRCGGSAVAAVLVSAEAPGAASWSARRPKRCLPMSATVMTSGLRTQPHAGGQVAGQPEGDVARMVRLNGAVDRAHRASKAWMSSHPLWGKDLSEVNWRKGTYRPLSC
jgi:hypothetical protein